jgi:folate-dependent tRNA-U54 methylase TrmFO/GidA
MQQTYDIIQQYIVNLINKYRYQHFNGPLTASNVSTLVELSKVRDPSKIYDVLNKSDMEIRINYLEIMKYLANRYTIDNKKADYVYSIFTWEDYKVFNSYRQLKEKDKQKLWKLFLKNDIYFECLSPELLLLGFKLDKQYTFFG